MEPAADRRNPRPGSYLAAIALAGAAVAARALLEPAVAGRARFLVPLAIVAIIAAFAGRGPAIAAAVTGAVATLIGVTLLDPQSLDQEVVPLILFASCVLAVVFMAERLRGARATAQHAAADMAVALEDRDRALGRLQAEHRLAERRAKILEGTQDLSVATATVLAPADAADRILEIAMGVLGADTGAIAVIDEPGSRLDMLAMRGYPRPIVDQYASIPLDADLTIARVAASGEPAWLESGDERRRALPPGAADTLGAVGGVAMLPVHAGGHVVGALSFGLPHGQRIQDEDRAFIELVARKAGQALERARLTEARRRADRAERERAEQLRTVLETMPDGIAVVSGGAVRYRNAALDRLAGTAATTVDELAHAFGVDPSGLLSPTPAEIELPGPGGARRWLEAGAIPIGPGPGDAGLLLVVRDVTGARAAAAVQDAYVGMLSHELRTPVTVILASAGLLERRHPAGDPDRELVADIVAESERMSRLIDDLLVLSLPDSGPSVHPEPVLMRQLLAEATGIEAVRHPGLTILTDVPTGLPPVAGDRTLLIQVVRNLIGNAAKYAGPSATVRIEAREADGCVATSVSDDGPGIAAHEREAVFEIFFRSGSTAGRARGAGIGLFVCRRLVEAMHGRISAGEAPGGGACIRFEIPVYAAGGPGTTSPDVEDAEDAEHAGTGA